jgi:hypothetical protein
MSSLIELDLIGTFDFDDLIQRRDARSSPSHIVEHDLG